MQPFVSVRCVSKRYEGRPVVDSVSLQVHARQSVVIVAQAAAARPRCCG